MLSAFERGILGRLFSRKKLRLVGIIPIDLGVLDLFRSEADVRLDFKLPLVHRKTDFQVDVQCVQIRPSLGLDFDTIGLDIV